MELGPVLLSRLQFAWVVGWHILLPAFTVGIASFITLLEGLRLFTGREVYGRISTFLIKIFAIAFGMGVVTGIVMSGRRPLIKGYFRRCAGRRCGHVFGLVLRRIESAGPDVVR